MNWLKALPYLVAVAICAAWTAAVFHVGGEARGTAVRLEWQGERTANARAVANSLERTLDAERALTEGLAARDLAHKKEIDHVRSERDHFERLLGTGAVRVSVPATCRPVVASGPAAAGEPAETRAELDPAFAAAVAGITSDGDFAIVDLNACIDRYNEVRARLNTLIGNTGAQTP